MNTAQIIHDQAIGILGTLSITCAIGAGLAALILLCYGGAYLCDWRERRKDHDKQAKNRSI